MNPNANTLGIFTEHVPRMGCPHCGAELDVSDFDVFEDITCPSCQKSIKVPGILGNFVLLEELGRGAMGCVYLAQDESLGRLVALKVMRREFGDDPKMLETLQREAQAMATLNHPNVVQVYSFGRESGQPYFVMELLQGERLDAMMADGGIVNEMRLLEIAIDVARGLEAAGNAGLTHGDIKPANILMNDAGLAKVVDFGLARFMEPGAEIEVWGTPYYIAPEKARKKGEDSRSDQYSLGATMYHALAGHPPFDGESPTKVVIAALKTDTPDLRADNPEVTPETAAVIRRMMDKTPARRFPTYASLLADLEVALNAARRVAEEKRALELMDEMKKKTKRNPLPLITAGVTLAIFVAAGAVLWMNSRRQKIVADLDKWPDRKLELPILKVEERNLREAAVAARKGNFTQVEYNLSTVARLVPDEHAAKAWYRFFAAGTMLYSQYPDRAKALLEQAAAQDPIVFSGGVFPPEDPRILARFALDQMNERDFDRAVSKSAWVPYYHLAELAKGYRYLLANRPNDSARHFKAYGEIQAQSWPYVLQPLAATFHLPREQLVASATGVTDVPAPRPTIAIPITAPTPTPVPAAQQNTAIRSPEGRPLFKLADLDNSQKAVQSKARDPSWSRIDSGNVAGASSNQVLSNALGTQILPGRRFSVGGILRSPPAGGKQAVLFHLGGPIPAGSNPPAMGLVLDVPDAAPGDSGPSPLRLRLGDGKKDRFTQTISSDVFKPGTVQLFVLSWDSLQAARLLTLSVDGETLGQWTIPDEDLPPPDGLKFVSWGRGLGDQGMFNYGAGSVEVIQAMVLDHVPEFKGFYKLHAERIRNWNHLNK